MTIVMPKPIRVLLIDDDLADRELTRLALDRAEAGTFEVLAAASLESVEPLLRSDNFDALLLDLGLPGSSGLETLRMARAMNRAVPIVVLTDLSDEQAAFECLNHGAQDYLLKSHLSLESLSRSLRYSVQRQQLHDQLSSANAQLEQRNKDLARMCETAQRFVDNVSHEFRTPLTVITEYVSLLQDGVVGAVALDAEQLRFLKILADRADDLNRMVDDMLDVSKLQAGLLNAWRRDCDLADILRHLRPALESKAAIKRVQLEFQVGADLPVIYCDGEKLGRVLINLVVNAIKFCGDPGRVLVTARANPANREILISVADNGPGISPEEQETIFGRFQQLEPLAQNAHKGFGLGLSIAKELVDLNLGEMFLESSVGQGSAFSFSVPVADPVEVVRRALRRRAPNAPPGATVAILEATLPQDWPDALAGEVDAFLHYLLRPEDMLFRTDLGRWLILAPMADSDVEQYVSRARQMVQDSNRNRPGRSLPELAWQAHGEWRGDDGERLLGALRDLLTQREAVDV